MNCISCLRVIPANYRKGQETCCGCDHGLNRANGYNTKPPIKLCSRCCSPERHKPCERCGGCAGTSKRSHNAVGGCDCIPCHYCGYIIKKECSCCPDKGAIKRRDGSVHKYCEECCRLNKHMCCNEPIEQKRRDLVFWTPTTDAIKVDGGYQPLAPFNAEHVLTLEHYSPADLNKKRFSRNKSRRYVASEIEVSRVRKSCKKLNQALRKWSCSVVHDGTVPEGFEINTSPANGDAVYDQVYEICDGLSAAEAMLDTNQPVERTPGLHVHVDARDYGYQEVQKMVHIYTTIEDAIFAAVPVTRFNNRYCRPCKESYSDGIVKPVKTMATREVKAAIIKTAYPLSEQMGARVQDARVRQAEQAARRGRQGVRARPAGQPAWHTFRDDHYGDRTEHDRNNRYTSMNLHSWFMRGTIEFRQHHGTVDPNEIYNWMLFVVNLFDAAYKLPHSKLKSTLTVSENEIEKVRKMLDMPDGGKRATNSSWLRTDLDKSAVASGVEILSRLVPSTSFDHIVKQVRRFALGGS